MLPRFRPGGLAQDATDTPLEGPASPGAGAVRGPKTALNVVTTVTEMMISEDAAFEGAMWEPYVTEKPWTLGCHGLENCIVFAKFRDGAGNESLIVNDSIYLNVHLVYLPLVFKNE